MRMRELYKCEACGKYLTKKSLNYSHFKTCKGNPENQVAKPKKKHDKEDNDALQAKRNRFSKRRTMFSKPKKKQRAKSRTTLSKPKKKITN